MTHQYKLNGYNIVLDVFSGSVHTVDSLAYDIIALFEDHTEEEIISAMLDKYAAEVRPEEFEAVRSHRRNKRPAADKPVATDKPAAAE